MKLSNLTLLILTFFLFVGFLGFLVHCNQDAIKKNADDIQKIQDNYVTSQTLTDVEKSLYYDIDVIFGKQKLLETKVDSFERMWTSNTLDNTYNPWLPPVSSKTTTIAKE